MGTEEKRAPQRLSDLHPADYNPREITEEALAGLAYSVETFGDLSGIVWNARTGHLVCGHQRVRAIQERCGDLALDGGAVVLPSGHRFPVRIVEWDEAREKAANVAANAPTISGTFTDDLPALLAEIEAAMPDAWAGMAFGDLIASVDPAPVDLDEQPPAPLDDAPQSCRCPKCGFEFVP